MESVNTTADARDPEAFRRVWERVTAGQESSPVVPALPAAPRQPPPDDRAQLHRWMDRLAADAADASALARRWPGPCAQLCRSHVQILRQLLRRLDAACLLMTGQRYRPCPGEPPKPCTARDTALRQRWLRLHRWSLRLRSAPDGPMQPLYRQLTDPIQTMAGEVLTLLEQLSPL